MIRYRDLKHLEKGAKDRSDRGRKNDFSRPGWRLRRRRGWGRQNPQSIAQKSLKMTPSVKMGWCGDFFTLPNVFLERGGAAGVLATIQVDPRVWRNLPQQESVVYKVWSGGLPVLLVDMLLPAVPDPLEPFSGYENVKLSNSSSCVRTKSSYSAGAATPQIGVACVCQLFLHTFKRACSPIVSLEQAGPLSTSLSPGNFDNGVWQKEANAGNEGKRHPWCIEHCEQTRRCRSAGTARMHWLSKAF